jgi:membrane protease YdiL (CAAX protease family)
VTPEPELEASLDIQHDIDPAVDHGFAKRIPHIGHAILFFAMTYLLIQLCGGLLIAAAHIRTQEEIKLHPGVSALAQATGYLVALALSFRLFPHVWERSFLHGIQWNVLAAHRRWFWIMPSAISVSAAAQWAETHMKTPDDLSTLKIMSTMHGAWLLMAFGVLLAPLMEEIAFRGFLLPALATAYDWLSLERSPQGLRRWEMTSGHTKGAVIFGAIFSNIPFALMHAPQLQHAWGPVAVIFGVGLVFAWVRVKTHSVACSTLLHATYNLTIFAWTLIVTGGFRHLEKLVG